MKKKIQINKLAFVLLKRRKKLVIPIFLVMVIAGILNLLSGITICSILDYKIERALTDYGAFSYGINHITEEELEDTYNYYDKKNVGVYKTYQSVEENDTNLTIGYVDDTFLKLADIKLKEGRMPQKKGEIVVEEFVAEAIETEKNIFDKEKKYNIVGVIENYSGHLSCLNNPVKESGAYPNVLCFKVNDYEKEKHITSVIINTLEIKKVWMSYNEVMNKITQSVSQKGIAEDKVYLNHNLFSEGLYGCHELVMCSMLFSFLTIIILGVCVYVLFYVFYKGYIKKIAIMQAMGMEFWQTKKLLSRQMFYMFCSSNFISVVVAWILFSHKYIFFFRKHQFILIISIFSFFLLWVISLAFLLKILLNRFCKEVNRSSIAENLHKEWVIKKHAQSTEAKYKVKQLSMPSPKVFVLLVILFMITCIVQYMHGMAMLVTGTDYYLASKDAVIYETVDGYRVEEEPQIALPKDSIKKLNKYKGDIVCDYTTAFSSYSALWEKDKVPQHIKEWNKQYPEHDSDIL